MAEHVGADTTLPEQRLFIGGEFTDATSGETFDTINPATNRVIAAVQQASESDVDRAVAAARAGFAEWAAMPAVERARPDVVRFYEINPVVAKWAEDRFTYLSDARERGAAVGVHLGDGRIEILASKLVYSAGERFRGDWGNRAHIDNHTALAQASGGTVLTE